MDVEHYRNFIVIVDCGNLTAAATRLHLAQPALSAQLKALQKKYGAELVHLRRGARNLELTRAGAVFYEHAKHIVEMEESISPSLAATARGSIGTLRISLSPSMSINFIRNYLSGFARENPGVVFALHEDNATEQARKLLDGQADIGVINGTIQQAGRFEILMTRRERIGIVFRSDNPWIPRERTSLRLNDLLDVPLCLSRGCSQVFLSVCAEENLAPHVLSINTTKHSTLQRARENSGVAITPMSPWEELPGLLWRYIEHERLYLNEALYVVKGREPAAVARNFLKYYNEHV